MPAALMLRGRHAFAHAARGLVQKRHATVRILPASALLLPKGACPAPAGEPPRKAAQKAPSEDAPADSAAGKGTIVRQYKKYEEMHPRALVLLQVGDFFELFGEAAERASHVLDIAMCKTTRHGIAMTGFPVRSLDGYLERLVKAGISAVICEQFQIASRWTRRVTRIVTPGTLTEDALLDSRANNFLLALHKEGSAYALAWIDLSTGSFAIATTDGRGLQDELVRIRPVEIVMAGGLDATSPEVAPFIASNRTATAILDGPADPNAYRHVYGDSLPPSLDTFSPFELTAGLVLLTFVTQTQLDKKPFIEPPTRRNSTSQGGGMLHLDASALTSLEVITNNSTASRQNSLLEVLDVACTASGSRLLAQRLQNPLMDVAAINERLDLVQLFAERQPLCSQVRDHLKNVKDLERAFQRISLRRTAGGPRDLQSIQRSLYEAGEVARILGGTPHEQCARLAARFADCTDVTREIEAALVEAPPQRASDGGLIKPGYCSVLDALQGTTALLEGERNAILTRYRSETGKHCTLPSLAEAQSAPR